MRELTPGPQFRAAVAPGSPHIRPRRHSSATTASPQMRVSPTILMKSEGPFPGIVMASEACVEPTKTMMMPITREQPHAASARISLYTGMGSGGRLCTSPSFHNIAEPSRLSVSTASSPSRFAIRIRGLWAKAMIVSTLRCANLARRAGCNCVVHRSIRCFPDPGNPPTHTRTHTHTDVACILPSCCAETAVLGACAAQGDWSRACLVETVGSGRSGGRGRRREARLASRLASRPPVSSIMLSFASCGPKGVAEASFAVGATR